MNYILITSSVIAAIILSRVLTGYIRRYLEKKEAERKRHSQQFLADITKNRKQRVENYVGQFEQGQQPNLYWNKRKPK